MMVCVLGSYISSVDKKIILEMKYIQTEKKGGVIVCKKKVGILFVQYQVFDRNKAIFAFLSIMFNIRCSIFGC